GGVLFVNGNEVKTADGDRLLLIPGDSGAGIDSRLSTQEVLTRRSGGLAIVAYPEEFRSWGVTGYKGVEVYNIYTNARRINPLVMFFDGLWSYGSYPELLFATFYNRPAGNLQGWDQQIRQSGMRLVATAGNDAHANIGISINDSSGKTLLGFRLDPYERSFRLVRLHVLTNPFHAQTLDEGSLLSALAEGHCYIGFDVLGDSTGFRFEAQSAGTSRIMGDEIRLVDEVKLSVSTPVNSRIVLLRDGGVIQEANGANRLELKARERGSYRVEVYLPQLGKPAGEQPWIISNPIYVR
ncbi:MAG TPA: hypothetical protein VK208_11850, partial [Pyrinomonadaceae bacterium]|nr:hypothetical protein [Pyrinomonadaceae bacterium]